MGKLLEIKNLSVSVEEKEVLKNISISVDRGETHVLMGPNGAGKSTLMNTIMAHPKFKITSGKIFFKGEDITDMDTDERARMGIFMSFQNPMEIEGVRVDDFIRQAMAAQDKDYGGVLKFNKMLSKNMNELSMDSSYAERYINVGFSGGEKKKNEILQMKILDPSLALLDETDSGLDVDAVKIVSKGIKDFFNEDKALIIITHHQEILSELNPDFVHVIKDGRLVKSADSSLMEIIEKEGYQWIEGGEV